MQVFSNMKGIQIYPELANGQMSYLVASRYVLMIQRKARRLDITFDIAI